MICVSSSPYHSSYLHSLLLVVMKRTSCTPRTSMPWSASPNVPYILHTVSSLRVEAVAAFLPHLSLAQCRRWGKHTSSVVDRTLSTDSIPPVTRHSQHATHCQCGKDVTQAGSSRADANLSLTTLFLQSFFT